MGLRWVLASLTHCVAMLIPSILIVQSSIHSSHSSMRSFRRSLMAELVRRNCSLGYPSSVSPKGPWPAPDSSSACSAILISCFRHISSLFLRNVVCSQTDLLAYLAWPDEPLLAPCVAAPVSSSRIAPSMSSMVASTTSSIRCRSNSANIPDIRSGCSACSLELAIRLMTSRSISAVQPNKIAKVNPFDGKCVAVRAKSFFQVLADLQLYTSHN